MAGLIEGYHEDRADRGSQPQNNKYFWKVRHLHFCRRDVESTRECRTIPPEKGPMTAMMSKKASMVPFSPSILARLECPNLKKKPIMKAASCEEL